MLDREKILTVLHKRFPNATPADLAAAANALVGLEDEWEDVTGHEPEFGYHFSALCAEICYLAEAKDRGGQFRVFRRRASEV
jgi:phosphohistidine phosphatase SixA